MGSQFRYLATLSVLAGLALASCSSDEPNSVSSTSSHTSDSEDSTTDVGGGGPGRLPRALVSFDNCDSFLGYLKSEALARVGPYGLAPNGGAMPVVVGDVIVDQMSDNVPGSVRESAAPDGDASPTYTGTNVQEAGVDEADIVKTDGTRIVSLTNDELTVVDISSGVPVVTGTMAMDSTFASELFLAGDRAIVLSNVGGWFATPVTDVQPADTVTQAPISEPAPDEGGVATTVPDESIVAVPDAPTNPSASITEINLVGPGGPEIVNTLTIEGQYISARLINDTIRLAISSSPAELPWLYPQSSTGEQAAIEANRKVIENSTVGDWLPDYTIAGVGGESSGQLLSCESVRHPAEFAGFDTVSVLDIKLNEGLATPANAVGVLASGQQVYSSLDRFYVASNTWVPSDIDPTDTDRMAEWGGSTQTDVHAFALSDTEPTRYVASGSVAGSLLNQFSMDESGGYLRIVTTTGSPWARPNPDGGASSESVLTVLAEQGDQLVPVGQVGGLGRGETLHSARFFDDVGFAVTFRQTDPFYVLDLSDPTNPQVTGELKIPGVSTYLHPVSDTRILGIGQDATDDGTTTGLKLSLFDVSDRANPQEISVWTLPNSSSPAEFDHRAFQMVGPTAIVPVQQWGDSDGGFNGAIVFTIGDQIVEVGRVTNVGDEATPTSDCQPLDAGVLSDEGRQMLDIAQREGGYAQLCRSGAIGGWGTYSCNPIGPGDLEYYYSGGDPEAAATDIAALGLVDGDRIEICYPNTDATQAIQRSIVVDSTLFTIAPSSVVSTDLTTMNPTGRAAF